MRFFVSSLVMASLLTGCAGNDLLFQRQSSMEGRLEQLMQAQNRQQADVAALQLQTQELKDQAAKQSLAGKELQSKLDLQQERVRMLAARLVQVEAAKQPATIELVNQDSVPEGREESVQAAYMKAFGLFSANNFKAAAEAFRSFIEDYPESEYAVNARYWLGECQFSEGRYREAIETFSRVLDMNPSQKRGGEALLRIGAAWQRLGDAAKEAESLKLLMERFPGSDAAKTAKDQLDKK